MRNMASRCWMLLAVTGLVSLMHATPAVAQTATTKATLKGTVVDPDKRVVGGAVVIVHNDGSTFVRTTDTGPDGVFTIPDAPLGVYSIEVSVTGFPTARKADVRLTGATTDAVTIALTLGQVNEQVEVRGEALAAAAGAPSQGSLTATSAESIVSSDFIRNFTAPAADFAEVVQMVPGTYSLNPNGVGLGQGKTFLRGFPDGDYTMTFDGIPFQDTNSPTHHSWAFFPAPMIGTVVVDRSPGSAATLGPSNFGGSINMLSPAPEDKSLTSGAASYGSFDTRMFDAHYSTGALGSKETQNLSFDVQDMRSDGYQTFNHQQRDDLAVKYTNRLSETTTLTAFGSFVDLQSNTPNQTAATRAQIAQFGPNYLLSDDPTQGNYLGYNFYTVPTDFEYVGIKWNLGGGWALDDKAYMYAYHNHQNFNSFTSISATSATDKLNAYRTPGNILSLSQASSTGVFRTGLWSEYSFTNRFQIPSNPLTWQDAALPNFHETFNTLILEPYAEYEYAVTNALQVTGGVKLDYYDQSLTQFADNGKTVGSLNGAASITNDGAYHSLLPSFSTHYMLAPAWSAYYQYAQGDTIPPTNVFDVKNGAVLTVPKPTLAGTNQVGTVFKSSRFTLDFDVYHINFQNTYSSSLDPTTNEPVYFLGGNSVTRGVEGEANVLVGDGLRLYLNASADTAKYVSTGLWVANVPKDTQTVGVSYDHGSWDAAIYNKHIGSMWNDNGGTNQAIAISPFNLADIYLNYTLRNGGRFQATRFSLAVNNVFDNLNIVGVTAASTKTSDPSPLDQLQLLPGRSVSFTVTFGFSQK